MDPKNQYSYNYVLFISHTMPCDLIIGVRLLKISGIQKKRENLLIDFLNSYLFDVDFEKKQEIKNFKQNHLNTKPGIKFITKELLHFHKNLKGGFETALEELFLKFELDHFILKDLDKNS